MRFLEAITYRTILTVVSLGREFRFCSLRKRREQSRHFSIPGLEPLTFGSSVGQISEKLIAICIFSYHNYV